MDSKTYNSYERLGILAGTILNAIAELTVFFSPGRDKRSDLRLKA